MNNKKHNETAKQLISEKNKGKSRTPEQKVAMSTAKKGKKLSPDQIAAIKEGKRIAKVRRENLIRALTSNEQFKILIG